MQKHSERTDKRPPIAANRASAGGGSSGGGGSSSGVGSIGPGPSNGLSVTSMNAQLSNVAGPLADNPYWPKVSPDSVTSTLSEVLQQQQQQQASHHQQLAQQQQQQTQHHHQMQHDFGLQPPSDLHQREAESGDNLAAGSASTGGSRHSLSASSSSALNGSHNYDKSSVLSNSAFTPIQSMAPHLNSLGHHHPHHHHHAQLGQRPYLYDAINFGQNKNPNQMGAAGNSFPNQLISLHQIRNYAHQPGTLMSGGDHLLGVSVGAGKEKC